MFKCKYSFIFFLAFILLNTHNLSSSLLSENIIVLPNESYTSIKNLNIGDLITSLDCSSNIDKFCYSKISGIKINRNCMDSSTLMVFESEEGYISSIVVGSDQKFYVISNIIQDQNQIEDLTSVIGLWLSAKNISKGSRVKIHGNKSLIVKDICPVKYKNRVDSYELSLNDNHTFYIVDSNGNFILTHNIFGLDDLLVICVGGLIGGVIGGGTVIYKSYKSNTPIPWDKFWKGAGFGFVVAAGITAIVYYGLYFCAKYLPVVLDKIKALLSHSPKIKEIISFIRKNPNMRIFIGTTISAAFTAGFSYIYSSVGGAFDENNKRENEDINFENLDSEEGAPEPEFESLNNEDMEVLFDEPFLDSNGNPILDRNGRPARILIMRYRNA